MPCPRRLSALDGPWHRVDIPYRPPPPRPHTPTPPVDHAEQPPASTPTCRQRPQNLSQEDSELSAWVNAGLCEFQRFAMVLRPLNQ